MHWEHQSFPSILLPVRWPNDRQWLPTSRPAPVARKRTTADRLPIWTAECCRVNVGFPRIFPSSGERSDAEVPLSSYAPPYKSMTRDGFRRTCSSMHKTHDTHDANALDAFIEITHTCL